MNSHLISVTALVRACSDDFRQLSIGALRRAGALVPGRKSQWSVDGKTYSVLAVGDTVSLASELVIDDQHIKLTFSVNGLYNNIRSWFVCPGCECRTHKLYDRERLQCVRCAKLYFLTKLSSGKSDRGSRAHEHALRGLRKIRVKLGWPLDDPYFTPGPKPKWMRWPTFGRLVASHAEARARWLSALTKQGARQRKDRPGAKKSPLSR